MEEVRERGTPRVGLEAIRRVDAHPRQVLPPPRQLVAAGRAENDALTDIGAVRIGACVREDQPKPDVTTMAALKDALLGAQSVLLTNAPTGDHLLKVIERIGLGGEVGRKLTRFDTATLLNKHLADHPGEGALGFGPTTEILVWRGKGVALAGTVPLDVTTQAQILALLARLQDETGMAILLIIVFSATLKWLPAGGMNSNGETGFVGYLKHVIMPALASSFVSIGVTARMSRASLID